MLKPMQPAKYIAHRGNCDGPNPALENSPEYLLLAIERGADIEVDVWVVDGNVYFGHDEPTYPIDLDFLEDIEPYAWFHCKNFEALKYFSESWVGYRFFWHQGDDYTITSTGHIWTYPGKSHFRNSIIVDLSPTYNYGDKEVYAVCVDYLGDGR